MLNNDNSWGWGRLLPPKRIESRDREILYKNRIVKSWLKNKGIHLKGQAVRGKFSSTASNWRWDTTLSRKLGCHLPGHRKIRNSSSTPLWQHVQTKQNILIRKEPYLRTRRRGQSEPDRQRTFKIILRRVRRSLLPWKSNKCHIFVCARMCACARARVHARTYM
jgi:hypothetical protein